MIGTLLFVYSILMNIVISPCEMIVSGKEEISRMIRKRADLVVGNTGSPLCILGADKNTINQHMSSFKNSFRLILGLGDGQR